MEEKRGYEKVAMSADMQEPRSWGAHPGAAAGCRAVGAAGTPGELPTCQQVEAAVMVGN